MAPRPKNGKKPKPVKKSVTVQISKPLANIYPQTYAGGTLTAKSIATGLGMAIPRKSKTTLAVSKSSKKFCGVKSGKLVGMKSGPCITTVTVQAPKLKNGKKPKPVKKSVTIQIT